MSLISLLFGSTKTTIGVLELDALLTESTTLSAQITAYPVEDGAVIADHISLDSEQLQIDGVICGAGTLFQPGGGKLKLIIAKEALRRLHQARETVTIVTGLDVYQDFALENCEISRDNESGEQFQCSLSLRKIRKVTIRTEDMPPDKAGSQTKGKAGSSRKPTGKATTSTVASGSKTSENNKIPAKKTALKTLF